MKKLMALIVLSAFLMGADRPKDSDTNQSKDLQGTWQVLTEIHGDNDTSDEGKHCQFIFKDDKLVVKKDGEVLIECTFKIDPTTKPPHMDLTVVKDDEAQGREGQKSLCIYKLDDDKLKLCACEPGRDDRPEKFDAAGTDFILVVMEKAKTK